MILGMAIGITLDARAAKQNAQDAANVDTEKRDNFADENTDLKDQK